MKLGRVALPVAVVGAYALGRRHRRPPTPAPEAPPRPEAAGPGPAAPGRPGSAAPEAGSPARDAAPADPRRPAREDRRPAAEDRPSGREDPLADPRLPTPEQVPGIDAETPLEIPAAGWRQVVRRAWRETKKDGIPLLAAGVAFYSFLALFPALIAAVSVYGLLADPGQVEKQINNLSDALPQESATLLADQMRDISTTSNGALGLGLVISVLGALFTASGGVANLIKAINLAYDEEETRNIVRLRGLALLLTLGAIVFLVVAVGLVAVLPAVLDNLGLGSVGQLVVGVLRWVGLVLFVVVALAVLYRYAPDRDDPRLSWVTLGAAVATVLWILGSVGFSVYVSNFGSYGRTYGTLAGVVVLLLWLFLTSFVVLLGAEINSEAEQQTAKDSTVGPYEPLGERNAVKADSIPTPEPRGR